MKYIEYVNGLIRAEVAKPEHAVLFGQNMNAGSCIGGLTRGLSVKPGGRIINSTNAENSLVGFGFGLMMNGAAGAFFMKQMDFLLLGIDQLVNTYNILRSMKQHPPEGSFTIVSTVVDSGYEGPQSSLNNFADFCSIARIPGYTITNKVDADYVLGRYLCKPGFRIIGVSQRLGKTEIIDPGEPLNIFGEGTVFQYREGGDATVVSFNYSFPQVNELCARMDERGMKVTHFNVNAPYAPGWEAIVQSVKATRKIVVVDDSKSGHVAADALLAELAGVVTVERKVVVKRQLGEDWLHPVSDEFVVDANDICEKLRTSGDHGSHRKI